MLVALRRNGEHVESKDPVLNKVERIPYVSLSWLCSARLQLPALVLNKYKAAYL